MGIVFNKRFLGILLLAGVAWGQAALPPVGFDGAAQGFIQNKGQWPDSVQYLVRGAGGDVWILDSGLLFTADSEPAETAALPASRVPKSVLLTYRDRSPGSGALGKRVDAGMHEGRAYLAPMHFFLGNQPERWVRDVPVYESVRVREVWPGVDLDYTIEDGALAVRVLGDSPASLEAMSWASSASGLPVLETAVRPLLRKADASGRPVACQWDDLGGAYRVRFEDDAPDGAVALDVLFFSTFIGGGHYDYPWNIGLASNGDPVVSGYTRSSDFPVLGDVYDSTYNGGYRDAFVCRFDHETGALLYSTLLGGSGDDYGYAMAVSPNASVYLCGKTYSSDFPTTSGAYRTSFGGSSDAFVLQLSDDGRELLWSSYLGGISDDYGFGLAVDGTGGVVATGWTESYNFPVTTASSNFVTTEGAYDRSFNGEIDAFLVRLDPTGQQLLYAGFLGGNSTDEGLYIALGADENPIVTGTTFSANFPVTADAYTAAIHGGGKRDVFVAVFDAQGAALNYSTYLGGSETDYVNRLTVDAQGAPLLIGSTQSTDFPVTSSAYQPSSAGDTDLFITHVGLESGGLLYSTYLGGAGEDWGNALVWEAPGRVWLAGYTDSPDYPLGGLTWDGSHNGGRDGMVSGLVIPHLQLVTPTSGAQWASGTAQTMTWTGYGMSQVALVLIDDEAPESPTTLGLFDGETASYSWNVPVGWQGSYHLLLQSVDPPGYEDERALTLYTASVSIQGQVSYALDGTPVPGVSLTASGDHDAVAVSDGQGDYAFVQIEPCSSLTVTPGKARNADVGEAISAYDAALVAMHAVGSQSLSQEAQQAADLDGDGCLTLGDAVFIARHAVGLGGGNDSSAGQWRFDPSSREYTPLNEGQSGEDYQAWIMGEVSGDWGSVQSGKAAINPHVETVVWEDTLMLAVGLSQDSGLLGADLWIRFDPAVLDFLSSQVAGVASDQQGFFYSPEPGLVKACQFGVQPVTQAGEIAQFRFHITQTGQPLRLTWERFAINEAVLIPGDVVVETPVVQGQTPEAFQLLGCYPNPFNPSTTLAFTLPCPGRVTLTFFDVLGRTVAHRALTAAAAGRHLFRWDGRDDRGEALSSGIYLCRVRSGEAVATLKLVKTQ